MALEVPAARGESTSTRIGLACGSGCRQKGLAIVMIGIDPHKGSHTAVVIDRDERVVDEVRVRTSNGQTGELSEWAASYPDRVWAVESAQGMGYLVSQKLVAAGERVIDVQAMMASRVRLLGSGKSQKTGPNDARSVANRRQRLASSHG